MKRHAGAGGGTVAVLALGRQRAEVLRPDAQRLLAVGQVGGGGGSSCANAAPLLLLEVWLAQAPELGCPALCLLRLLL